MLPIPKYQKPRVKGNFTNTADWGKGQWYTSQKEKPMELFYLHFYGL